eukprot:TRINITY_DN8953_c0_g1_i1.p1 TRINITY_DN8953_c0_g1~~TRINITY_DN8953_c0_g1_i1.p1  ORF type:complete len:336 (+),score=28.74 TRINITY_DN8953_c0_g1_i1:32-1039(+)
MVQHDHHAIQRHDTWDYNHILAIIFGVLVLYELVMLGRLIYYKHQFKSYSTSIWLLTFFWSVLRVLFFSWIIEVQWSTKYSWVRAAIEWYPAVFQFAVFSLLVVPLHSRLEFNYDFSSKEKRNLVFYAIGTISVLLVQTMWVVLSAVDKVDPDVMSNVRLYERSSSAFFYFLLLIVMAYFIMKISLLKSYLLRSDVEALKSLRKRVHFSKLISIGTVLFLLFFLQGINQLVPYFMLPEIRKNLVIHKFPKYSDWFPYFAYLLLEVLPTIMLFVLVKPVGPLKNHHRLASSDIQQTSSTNERTSLILNKTIRYTAPKDKRVRIKSQAQVLFLGPME